MGEEGEKQKDGYQTIPLQTSTYEEKNGFHGVSGRKDNYHECQT